MTEAEKAVKGIEDAMALLKEKEGELKRLEKMLLSNLNGLDSEQKKKLNEELDNFKDKELLEKGVLHNLKAMIK